MNIWVICARDDAARFFEYIPSADELLLDREFVSRQTEDQSHRIEFLEQVESDEVQKIVIETKDGLPFGHGLVPAIHAALENDPKGHLIIAANPPVLDTLREAFGRQVIGVIEQDLYEANESDLVAYVKPVFERSLRRLKSASSATAAKASA